MADPMYQQIADDLRARIESGELAEGEQLPTEIQLRVDYAHSASRQVSRNTVRDAIDLLVGDGLVEKRPGQGTFVVEKIKPFVTTQSGEPGAGGTGGYLLDVVRLGRKSDITAPRVEIHWASEAPELGLDDNAQVISRHQKRSIDGRPCSMQTSFYPMEFAEGANRLREAGEIERPGDPEYGAVAYIREQLGIKQVGWRDRLLVRPPEEDEVTFFKLPSRSVQVMEARRTAFAEDGRPMRLTVTVYATDRNHVVYEVGKVPPEMADAPAGSGDAQGRGS